MIFYNAKIFTAVSDPIENGYIKTKNGKITKIGKTKNLKLEKTGMLNLEGGDVYPGFIDAHCHMGMTNQMGYDLSDINDNSSNVTPHYKSIYSINKMDNIFKEALFGGITTVVIGAGSSSPISGDFIAIKTNGKIIDKSIVKDPVGIKFSLGENPKKQTNSPNTRMGVVNLIRETLINAKLDKSNNPKNETLKKVLRGEIKAFFHCHRSDDIMSAIRISKEFNIKSVYLHATEGYLISDELKDKELIIGPLLTDKSKDELKNLSLKSPKILHENNISFAMCSDYPETLPQFLPLMVGVSIKEGLKKEEALSTITINSAKICNIDKYVGSLEVGKDCDFNVYKQGEDVFNVYASPLMVVINSKVVKKDGNYERD